MSVEPSKAKPGEILFVGLFFAAALFLLTQLGEQAKFSAKGKLFAQPAFWPAVGVIGMVVFTGLHLLTTLRHRAKSGLGAEVAIWLRAFEYVGWFMIYVIAVPRIGYLPCTIVFTVLLALRMGYRKPATLFYAGVSGLAIVVIFKTILGVKIPGGAIYEHLPDGMRSFMILNF
nr:tripartite tricarboxylate transporter TctB family protein [Amylibacter sp.]